jgi:hypothetical protein
MEENYRPNAVPVEAPPPGTSIMCGLVVDQAGSLTRFPGHLF